MCTPYKTPILACSSNVPCFTANRERRWGAGQLAAQENARYKDSYLRAFDPARPLHLESWVQRDMQKGFTDDRDHETRQQVPLALCWAITMHKSQGQTMDKAVVDLGKSKSTAGLTFVCLSRAKRLVDLLIEPMPLKRLSKIGDTPTSQLRLREEVRLNVLAGETLRLHGGVE